MPIYMEVEGIKGNVTAAGSRPAGGMNFSLSDGSVKEIGRSGGDSRILVSRVSVPNTQFGAFEAQDANAVVKTRALFAGQNDLVVSRGLILSVSTSGPNRAKCANNLRQLAIAASGRISTVKLLVTDASDPSGAAIELENVRVTSYSLSAHGGAGTQSYSLNFTKITYNW
jgi:hypothetical protein